MILLENNQPEVVTLTLLHYGLHHTTLLLIDYFQTIADLQ